MRLQGGVQETMRRALEWRLPVVQTFLTLSDSASEFTDADRDYMQFHKTLFAALYMHVSYKANMADVYGASFLKRELACASSLAFTHAVVHPGSGKWCQDKQKAIALLVKAINKNLKLFPHMTLLLENAAHGAYTIAGDIADFALILPYMDYPERVFVCIDTAHAFAYSYDISRYQDQDAFIDLVDAHIGWQKVALLHVNDAARPCGSKIDMHALPGQGLIGMAALQRFVSHHKLQHIPLLIEPPVSLEYGEQAALDILEHL